MAPSVHPNPIEGLFNKRLSSMRNVGVYCGMNGWCCATAPASRSPQMFLLEPRQLFQRGSNSTFGSPNSPEQIADLQPPTFYILRQDEQLQGRRQTKFAQKSRSRASSTHRGADTNASPTALKDHLGQTRVRTVVANDDAESRTKPRERESERAAGEGD